MLDTGLSDDSPGVWFLTGSALIQNLTSRIQHLKNKKARFDPIMSQIEPYALI